MLPVQVAYKQNRVVFFDSNLFHRSGKHRFKKGYKHMRINMTLLFGLRRGGSKAAADKKAGSVPGPVPTGVPKSFSL